MGAKSIRLKISLRPGFLEYGNAVQGLLAGFSMASFTRARSALETCRRSRRNLFLCGNGGSAANANHLATDLVYGVGSRGKPLFRAHSLAANPSVLTCLGNDTGYAQTFSRQLRALAQPWDVLVAFSGSGNSPNIIEALRTARRMKVLTIAFLGFSGGACPRRRSLYQKS